MTAAPALVERARAGDLAAFNELVSQHERQVYGICLRMLGQPAAAEDAGQEAFLSAWRNIGRLRGDRFTPWLLRIAANVCTDELRRRRRRPGVSLEDALEEGGFQPSDPDPTPEASALSGELRRTLESALALLGPEQRLAVILSDIEGLDYQEIADVMGSSLGTVKSRLSRARAQLRQILLADRELLPAQFRRQP
jgi:RNA polymerase sigma-70 factor (ECF subfamily)